MKTRKKPYTNKELFNIIVKKIKEENLLLDILDYASADSSMEDIKTYEFDIDGSLQFGGNEGIYVVVFLIGNFKTEENKIYLGTFKTLRDDKAAFLQMAELMANFLWYGREFVNENIDDFEWTGYKVDFYNNEKRTMGYSVHSEERAIQLIMRNYKYNWTKAIITNNETNKTKTIPKEDMALE